MGDERHEPSAQPAQGRESLFALDPKAIIGLQEYLALVSGQWDDALGRLKAFVERCNARSCGGSQRVRPLAVDFAPARSSSPVQAHTQETPMPGTMALHRGLRAPADRINRPLLAATAEARTKAQVTGKK